MDPSTKIASLLAPIDPQASATRILHHLVTLASAKGGVVLVIRGYQPYVFASDGITLDDMPAINDLWHLHAAWLFAGDPIVEPNTRILQPLLDGAFLAGVLYLREPTRYDSALVSPFVDALAAIMSAATTSTQRNGSVKDFAPSQRDSTLRALQRAEWNIAAAARLLGVTRRTVYLRMEKFSIPRERIAKVRARRKVG